jgi:4-alpha-glucanotransferase
MKRCTGVLFPVSSLPSRFGIGDFGERAKQFVDILVSMGFKLWQILPLNPIGYGHSPYQPFSSFAIDELYVSLDELAKEGLLKEVPSFNENAPKVEYETIRTYKEPFLKEAYKAEMAKDPDCLEIFASINPWVRNWSIFMSMKRSEKMVSWNSWPLEKQNALLDPDKLSSEQKEAANYEIWLQKVLYEQWGKIKTYANHQGVKIIGDLPFYVGFDSCDVYEDRTSFLLDPNTHEPLWIAGVPPDYFSKTGQRWGNPIYDWDKLEKTHFALLINRIKRNSSLYDIIRLDHFRAFDTYWKIPASCPTAVEGKWIEAPGYKFFDTLLAQSPKLEIIAEDLGDLRPQVLTLRDHYKFPGMNVIEFTFHDAAILKKPGYDKENMVAYLGTHDNDPLRGYFEKLPSDEKSAWISTLDDLGFVEGDINQKMIEYALSLPASYAIFSLQDILGLGSSSRLNVPSIIDSINWTWRITNFDAFEAKGKTIKSLIKKYNR